MNFQHILNEHGKWLNGEGGERANLRDADLQHADLCDADLQHADLCDADLRHANLRHANLHGADLHGADLHGAYLQGADLRGADLCRADLRRANLRRADLHGADLSGANLFGAGLYDANLHNADLHRANLRDANLWNTTGNMREVKSLQLEQYPVTYTATRLQIGCENHPIEQWWGFSESEIYDMDGQKAVDFWHKYKELIKEVIKTSPAVDTLVK